MRKRLKMDEDRMHGYWDGGSHFRCPLKFPNRFLVCVMINQKVKIVFQCELWIKRHSLKSSLVSPGQLKPAHPFETLSFGLIDWPFTHKIKTYLHYHGNK